MRDCWDAALFVCWCAGLVCGWVVVGVCWVLYPYSNTRRTSAASSEFMAQSEIGRCLPRLIDEFRLIMHLLVFLDSTGPSGFGTTEHPPIDVLRFRRVGGPQGEGALLLGRDLEEGDNAAKTRKKCDSASEINQVGQIETSLKAFFFSVTQNSRHRGTARAGRCDLIIYFFFFFF